MYPVVQLLKWQSHGSEGYCSDSLIFASQTVMFAENWPEAIFSWMRSH